MLPMNSASSILSIQKLAVVIRVIVLEIREDDPLPTIHLNLSRVEIWVIESLLRR
jgi:hypothetical protein